MSELLIMMLLLPNPEGITNVCETEGFLVRALAAG
jgi:hypothetical protein